MGTKVIFVLLILAAVLFFVMLGHGKRRNEKEALPNKDEDRPAYAQAHPPPDWIGGLIGPFIPRLKLDNDTFRFGPIPVPQTLPEGKSQFRKAEIEVTQGCLTSDCSNVVIVYESKDGEGQDLKLNRQTWRPNRDRPPVGSLVILKKGGCLTFQCKSVPQCTAVLR